MFYNLANIYIRTILQRTICKTSYIQSSICRHLSGSAYEHKNLKRMRLQKLLFSTVLFGGTLITAIILKKRHQKKLSETYRDCSILPKDLNYQKNSIHYLYKNYVLPQFVITNMKEIENFEVNDDDIFVVAFPKTGTTWLQEIIYLIATNLDFEKAKQVNIESRFPYLEFIYPGVSTVAKMPSPRFIKSHLPYSLLPPSIKEKSPKIFYIIRNPKDVAVSYYHFVTMLTMTAYTGKFKDFFESFIGDKVFYGPIWRHYLEFWEHKDDDNLFIISYEELQNDIKGSIEKIAQFLGKTLTEDAVDRIADHCSFANMSRNSSVNYEHWDDLGVRKKDKEKFMRKGKVGDWQTYFTTEMNERMDKWITEHFTKYGVQFSYGLKEIVK